MDKVQMVRQEVQATEWQNIIMECRNSGMPATKWCREKGINIKTYYYHLRKIREKACEQIAVPVGIMPSSGNVTVRINGIEAEISEGTSFQTISAVIQAMKC